MLNPKKLEQLAQQIHDVLPKGIKEFGGDIENRVKQVIQSQLTKLDVVSREDFDVQTQVLMRTREKLTALEQRVDELLIKLNNNDSIESQVISHDSENNHNV